MKSFKINNEIYKVVSSPRYDNKYCVTRQFLDSDLKYILENCSEEDAINFLEKTFFEKGGSLSMLFQLV